MKTSIKKQKKSDYFTSELITITEIMSDTISTIYSTWISRFNVTRVLSSNRLRYQK